MLAILTGFAPQARAAEASDWDGDARSAARLIAGAKTGDSGGREMRAGVEIKLAEGWKTYWRYPGDSGVPPRFDFAGSDNVAAVKVAWPAPHRFTDEGGTSIGYKGNVVFPLRVMARDPARPVTLRLMLDYAICEKLCVPAQANAALTWTGKAGANEAALDAAQARVPKKADRNAGAPFAIVAARRVSGAAKPLIFVDVRAPEGREVELFAEGPTAEWALPVPTPAQGAPAGHRHFGFELDGLPPGVDPKGNYALTFTLVAGGEAIEVTTHLD